MTSKTCRTSNYLGNTKYNKKKKYYLDIEPELRNRVKALAALKGKTMREWLTEAIIAKLEDEIDASEGLASLADSLGIKI
jgi:hypothetical protein